MKSAWRFDGEEIRYSDGLRFSKAAKWRAEQLAAADGLGLREFVDYWLDILTSDDETLERNVKWIERWIDRLRTASDEAFASWLLETAFDAYKYSPDGLDYGPLWDLVGDNGHEGEASLAEVRESLFAGLSPGPGTEAGERMVEAALRGDGAAVREAAHEIARNAKGWTLPP